jgi:hypothetical protein
LILKCFEKRWSAVFRLRASIIFAICLYFEEQFRHQMTLHIGFLRFSYNFLMNNGFHIQASMELFKSTH